MASGFFTLIHVNQVNENIYLQTTEKATRLIQQCLGELFLVKKNTRNLHQIRSCLLLHFLNTGAVVQKCAGRIFSRDFFEMVIIIIN